MVAVFNKEALSWYLLALKLNETVQGNLPRSQPSTPGSPFRPPPPPPIYLTRGDPIPEEQQREEEEEEEGGKDEEKERAVAAAAATLRAESEWAISIRDKLEQARHEEAVVPWSRFSIYRVPKSLREGDEKSYVPQVVSIGPYHHGKRRLRDMEHHKWRALYRVLRRTGHDVRLYLDAARALEDRCRACYEGRIALSSDEFVEMLVLDGAFVLELFRGTAGGAGEGFRDLGYDRNDPVFAMRGTMHGIQRDMIMLENQLPLFLLDRLLGLQIGRPDQHGFVARLAVRFFDPLMPTDEPLRKADRARIESSNRAAATESFDPLTETGLHCLDVFRRSLLRKGPKPEPRLWIKRWSHTRRVADRRRLQLIHCVTELREAGFKFRKRKTDRFWDIKFADGVLKIPRLLIHDGTKSLFLNLIALEQCHSDCTKDITSYVIFMDNLINSEADVSYLHYRGIIEHWLGNDGEVADLFNKLCLEVVFDFDDSYLSELSERVNRYYNHRWNTWGASLKHRYFENPWAIISLIAAVFLLLLTCAQTFYSVYAYYRPP